jgi:hypothetical protein
VDNHKITNSSATTKAREKLAHIWNQYNFRNFFDINLTKFENYQILRSKINHRFLVTTKLFSGQKSLMEQRTLKIEKYCWIIKIPFSLETSSG